MYSFPTIKVSDHSVKGVHTFWGSGSRGWSPLMGMKQVEPPYLYGFGVRIARRFVGLARERKEERPLVRELDAEQSQQIIQATKENRGLPTNPEA